MVTPIAGCRGTARPRPRRWDAVLPHMLRQIGTTETLERPYHRVGADMAGATATQEDIIVDRISFCLAGIVSAGIGPPSTQTASPASPRP
jgi:hypothetical protein